MNWIKIASLLKLTGNPSQRIQISIPLWGYFYQFSFDTKKNVHTCQSLLFMSVSFIIVPRGSITALSCASSRQKAQSPKRVTIWFGHSILRDCFITQYREYQVFIVIFIVECVREALTVVHGIQVDASVKGSRFKKLCFGWAYNERRQATKKHEPRAAFNSDCSSMAK